MDNFTFGLTMLVVGMGGTLAALAFLACLMGVLKKIFPVEIENRGEKPEEHVEKAAA